MATIKVELDENSKARVRVRGARHGRSMEEEAREILRSTLTAACPNKQDLGESIRRRFAALGGIEIQLPQRDMR